MVVVQLQSYMASNGPAQWHFLYTKVTYQCRC